MKMLILGKELSVRCYYYYYYYYLLLLLLLSLLLCYHFHLFLYSS